MRLFTLGFASGTLIIQSFSDLLPLWWPILSLFLLTVMLVWSGRLQKRIQQNRGRLNRIRNLLIILYGCNAGFILATYVAQQQLDARLPSDLQGHDLLVEGIIAAIPERFASSNDGVASSRQKKSYPSQGSTRFRLMIDTAYDQKTGKKLDLHGLSRISWYDDWQALQAGERWRFRVRLKQPSGFLNPGGFDYEKWLFSERIIATGYVRKDPAQNRRLKEAPWWSIKRLRQSIDETIRQRVSDGSQAAVLSALSVASRNGLSEDQWTTLRVTGTSHLVAISGLHIAMVAGFAFLPVWLLWRLFPKLNERIPVRVAGAVLALVFATAYALLAGFNLPTQRALIMVIVALTGLLLRRHDPASVLFSFALLAVLLFDPLAGMTISFWLSFIAVGLILLISQRQLVRGGKVKGNISGKISGLVSLQVLLSLGLFPVSVVFFGSGSLVSPIANLLAIPWVSFVIVPLNLLGVMLIPLSSTLADLFLQVAAQAVNMLFVLLNWLSSHAASSVELASIPFSLLLLSLAGILFLLLPSGLPARWLSLIALAPVAFYQPVNPRPGAFDFTLLDAGQGMASVIQTNRHTLLYDAGTRVNERFDVGRMVVVPFLKKRAIDRLDLMVISHEDLDHRGGAEAVLESVNVNSVMSSDTLILPTVETKNCVAGDSWIWDGVVFEILSPSYEMLESSTLNDNNRSCVLRVSNNHHSLLLTGDIESNTESWLIDNDQTKLRSKVMIVPHHGSKTSSTPAFIDAVKPELALVPAGYRNRFGHPRADVLSRYIERNIRVLKTVESGAIELHFPAQETTLSAHEFRPEHRRFWNRVAE